MVDQPAFPSEVTPGALAGVTVLDLSRVLAGPYCTMMLADLGADVIKVEAPQQGDDTRHWGPPFAGGESAYFLAVNRGKKSITVNLKTETGREIIRALAQRADVLIENFRAGSMEEWGLGYSVLQGMNPCLIYCAITGYGQTGPYRDRPGYDFIIQAQGGIMSVSGPEEGPPMKVGVAIVDITAGLYAAVSILAALHERATSGLGQYIDMALLDTQVAWLANVGSNFLISGDRPRRYGNAHPNIVPYETFATQDGWIALAVGNDRQWQQLCSVAGWADLAADGRFSTNPQRVELRQLLVPVLQVRFRQRTSFDWEAALLAAGVPCAPIQTVDQVFADPQVLAREMLLEMPHPTAGTVRLAGSPLKLSRTPARPHEPPPLLGRDTATVLAGYLHYSPDQIAELEAQGVV